NTIRLNAYGLGTFLSAPAVSLTDAKGNSVAIVIQTSTAHAIDVQIPASAAPGGAYIKLLSGDLKYFVTLFLDNQDNIPALNGCTYETSPASANTGSDANLLPILVITQDGCPYSVSTGDSFVSGSSSANGASVISIGFASNSGAARMATIEI